MPHPSPQHLEATAALLERAYRLALELEEGEEGGGREHTASARELVSLLDDARASLLRTAWPPRSLS